MSFISCLQGEMWCQWKSFVQLERRILKSGSSNWCKRRIYRAGNCFFFLKENALWHWGLQTHTHIFLLTKDFLYTKTFETRESTVNMGKNWLKEGFWMWQKILFKLAHSHEKDRFLPYCIFFWHTNHISQRTNSLTNAIPLELLCASECSCMEEKFSSKKMWGKCEHRIIKR